MHRVHIELNEFVEFIVMNFNLIFSADKQVTQGQWEDEIIWNGDDCKQKILAKNTERYNTAGWIPSGANRTASAFIKQVRGSTLPSLGQKPSNPTAISTHGTSKKDKNKDQSVMEAEKDETW